jgi:hypothetical protein
VRERARERDSLVEKEKTRESKRERERARERGRGEKNGVGGGRERERDLGAGRVTTQPAALLREHGDFNSHVRLSEKGTLFGGGGQRNSM